MFAFGFCVCENVVGKYCLSPALQEYADNMFAITTDKNTTGHKKNIFAQNYTIRAFLRTKRNCRYEIKQMLLNHDKNIKYEVVF